MTNAHHWITHLQLLPHPEGGYYRQTYRSPENIARAALPARFTGDRAFATAIYFLLTGDQFSALHRIAADELWHFYTGSSLTLHLLAPSGDYTPIHLGPDGDKGEVFQAVAPAGCYFGATVDDPDSFTLVGCTVAPGFDFADFELPTRSEMLARFPQHGSLILRLTR